MIWLHLLTSHIKKNVSMLTPMLIIIENKLTYIVEISGSEGIQYSVKHRSYSQRANFIQFQTRVRRAIK